MSLLDQATLDVAAILTDSNDFGLSMTVTDPAGTSATITGFAADIGQSIDPDTGQPVSGRTVHASLSLSALAAAGLGQPRGIADQTQKPWLVAMQLPGASAVETFKVVETLPDLTVGCVVCLLSFYKPAP